MKSLIKIVAILLFVISFVILNYVTIPFLDTLDRNSFSDAALGIIIILAHILIPSIFLSTAIFNKHDFD